MSPKKILVVDDDQDTLRGLNLRLRANGYDTVFATDAISAISVANRERPDLIILDLGLPGGDGYIVMDRLRALSPVAPTPIIVLSAKDPLVHQDKSLKAGAQAFLQKPADNEILLAAIRKALGESPGGVPNKDRPYLVSKNPTDFLKAKDTLPVELRLLHERLVNEYSYHCTILHGAGYAPYEEVVPYDILAALIKDGWRPIAPAVEILSEESQAIQES